MKKISCFFLLVFFGFSFGQKTLKWADSLRKSAHIPELTYAVITDHKILEIAALGKHAVHLQEEARLEDRFHLGSNTKAMTAFMISKQVEKGLLSWESKFFDFFPEWKGQSKIDYHNMTLLDLLSHRAKIQPFQGIGEEDPIIPKFTGSPSLKRKQFGKFVLTLDPIVQDSLHHFTYSNAGYTLASLMLEKASQKSWERLVDEIFNKDLKLEVRFSWPENQKRKDTWGHLFDHGQIRPIASNAEKLEYTEPSADLNMKLKDYIKFIQLHLKGLKGGSPYLTSATYHFLHEGLPFYALGWYNIDGFSTHSGTAGTYYTIASIDRKKNIAYIVFANLYSEETTHAVRLLMRKLKKEY